MKRRTFLTGSALALLGATVRGGAAAGTDVDAEPWLQDGSAAPAEPIIDIHQHVGYSGRPDAVLLAHQRALGVTTTILLPAGRPMTRPSTHDGLANGLQAKALGNEACYQFARAHRTGADRGSDSRSANRSASRIASRTAKNPAAFLFGANEVPDADDATREIERYLKRGAVVIGEQKFGVECDSPEMQRIYALAQEHRVPVLMHWQFQRYNYGFERFHTMLEKYPRVTFIGHAQTWWANIDKQHADQTVLYPKGPVTPGGLTDRYLSDYPNMFGDLSAGSGLNALTRDEAFARDFVTRHQDKLLFGSDCDDLDGHGPKCQGAQTIAALRRLAASKQIERKLLADNATRVFRL